MATSAYLTGRRRYTRPQGILWSNNAGTLSNGLYVPTGVEVGASTTETDPNLLDQFIILSDHNRGDMQFNTQRIEQRQRTINGRMRSYHIADKLTMSVSWNMLPSRGYSGLPNFNATTGVSPSEGSTTEYTADGGAGGVELLDWYETHQGPFFMYLAYDKYTNLEGQTYEYTGLNRYNQIIEVYFADFNYSVVKRGATNHDLWNISVTLEEV
jgi:hypothetical protein